MMHIARKRLWWYRLVLVFLLAVLVGECYSGVSDDEPVTFLKSDDERINLKDIRNELGIFNAEKTTKDKFEDKFEEVLGETKRIMLQIENPDSKQDCHEFETRKIHEKHHAKLLRKYVKLYHIHILVLIEYFDTDSLKELVKQDKLRTIATMLLEALLEEADKTNKIPQRENLFLANKSEQKAGNKVLLGKWGAFGGYEEVMKVGLYYTARKTFDIATMDLIGKEMVVEAGKCKEKRLKFMDFSKVVVGPPRVLQDLLEEVERKECNSLSSQAWQLPENGGDWYIKATLYANFPSGEREVKGPLMSFIIHVFQTMCHALATLVKNDKELQKTIPMKVTFPEDEWPNFSIHIRKQEWWRLE